MTEYRRFYIPKAMWFYTVNFAERKNNHLLLEKIDVFRDAFRYECGSYYAGSFTLHREIAIRRWRLFDLVEMLKGWFSRCIRSVNEFQKVVKNAGSAVFTQRAKWQRQFLAHLIED